MNSMIFIFTIFYDQLKPHKKQQFELFGLTDSLLQFFLCGLISFRNDIFQIKK